MSDAEKEIAKTTVTNENIPKGVLLSLLAVVAGIIAWVALWRFGFIASIVAFLIAWLAVKLYTIGAGGISRRTAPIVITVIVVGIVLAFLAGMASDAATFFAEDKGMSELDAVMSRDFWSFYFESIFTNSDLWSDYFVDLLISLAFGALGAYGTIRSLFVSDDKQEEK